MAKNTRPTDDMLAASLMEGRKAKKESPQAPQIQAQSKTESSKTTLPGVGFFKSLTQRDTPKDKAEGFDPEVDIAWEEDQALHDDSVQGLSGVVKHNALGFRFEDDNPGPKTLHELQSNLIDFDENPVVQSTNIEKMNKVRNKTLWDVSREDDLERISSQPKDFLEDLNEVAHLETLPDIQLVSQPAVDTSLSESVFTAAPVHTFPVQQLPDQKTASHIPISQIPTQGRPLLNQIPSTSWGSLKGLAITQKLTLSGAAFFVPLGFLIIALGMLDQRGVALFGALLSLGLAIACMMFVIRQITRPLSELRTVSERLGQGDLSTLASVESDRDIGIIAQSLNQAILQLREANQRQERDLQQSKQLQMNIADFLNVAIEIAQGDLTKRGRVSEDKLGNVVDAINLMTEEFSILLQDIQKASTSVLQGSDQMQDVAGNIASKTQQQVSEAQKANQNVQGVIKSIRAMASNVDTSSKAAEQTLQASTLGQQSVSDTLQGMQLLRQDVQSVASQVRQLGQQSQGITTISETISDIASQTSLLALGASLEAAGAGESGRRFAVVAEEVSRLAERSADSARQVTALVQSIQREVQLVVKNVEKSSTRAEQSFQVATQAGQRLEEIAQIARQSSEIAKAITQVTKEQVARIEQVGQGVQAITGLSEASQASVVQGRDVADRLQVLASRLSNSLSHFKLN